MTKLFNYICHNVWIVMHSCVCESIFVVIQFQYNMSLESIIEIYMNKYVPHDTIILATPKLKISTL